MLYKKVNLFLLVVMLLSVLSACAAPAAAPTQAAAGNKPIKIGVSMKFDDLWLTTLRDAMTKYAASQPGVELIMVDSKEDVATQLGQVENFVSQKVYPRRRLSAASQVRMGSSVCQYSYNSVIKAA